MYMLRSGRRYDEADKSDSKVKSVPDGSTEHMHRISTDSAEGTEEMALVRIFKLMMEENSR